MLIAILIWNTFDISIFVNHQLLHNVHRLKCLFMIRSENWTLISDVIDDLRHICLINIEIPYNHEKIDRRHEIFSTDLKKVENDLKFICVTY